MAVQLSLQSDDTADMTWDLHTWLSDEPELRRNVRVVQHDPEPGALGPVVDGLQLALGSGGAFATAATVIIAWLRAQRGSVTVKFTREGQSSLEVSATGVKNLDAAGMRELTEHLTRILDETANKP
ncbi:hypothetical protein ACFFV7_50310 [Nonomuraea spiralis]|uniref:Uncharacterized protein n=1 Tax=Nonomuraea spiralis TaxID=46182 RepID=A0ABV5IY37_9ACTN|nr:hypothetical protein [Nonomuraea spiralis]GGS89398.1 hypothetical protein GCM10010176_036650 [Nonomuraea spiralis]